MIEKPWRCGEGGREDPLMSVHAPEPRSGRGAFPLMGADA